MQTDVNVNKRRAWRAWRARDRCSALQGVEWDPTLQYHIKSRQSLYLHCILTQRLLELGPEPPDE